MIEPSRLTKHERRVLVAALEREKRAAAALAHRAKKERTYAMAKADLFVADDLIRQLADR